ncbi:MIP family channel protein [Betaproteobacteria bacterium SCGC AG-212-J23]|nr:MIP family channel protein [Betaproteobacteria bacterium SCGC AG-212-J23]
MSWRRALADGVGTALLLAAVVGSGIMGEKLAQGNDAIALLANSLATGCALLALIIAFSPRSGAHFNPLVTLALAIRGDVAKREVAPYIVAQFLGALLGVAAAHLMFDLPLLQYSAKARSTFGLWWSEVVATFGLVLVVLSCKRPWEAPLAVAGYIAAAYWFTASTSFANPAVTLARGFTDTFAGIDLRHVAPFILAQLLGAGLALLADRTWRP